MKTLMRWPLRLCGLLIAIHAFKPPILLPLQPHHHKFLSHVFVSHSLTSPAAIFIDTTLQGLRRPQRIVRTCLGTRTESVDEYVEAEDLDGLQDLFNRYCDREGLMTKSVAKRIPAIAELLEDLSTSDFDTIWRKVDKFPETDAPEKKLSKANLDQERIDVDSFVKLYRAIDDLFEDADDPTLPESTVQVTGKSMPPSKVSPVEEDPVKEDELESIFQQVCDASGLLTKDALREWDEVCALFKEGLLGEDEFNRLWDDTRKCPGTTDKLDVQGFLSFNVALDDLFYFEEEESEVDSTTTTARALSKTEPVSPRMVEGDDLSPDVLFVVLANEDGLVGRDELSRWSELQDMLEAGDLFESELDDIFAKATKSEKDSTKLDEKGFTELFQAIDDLFEQEEEEVSDGGDVFQGSSPTEGTRSQGISIKKQLYDAISALKGDQLLPCGLDALETEQKQIMAIVDRLEKIPSNFIRSRQGNIKSEDLTGTWELIYSSSSAMKFNKGLSGLGGSFPNGRFAGLKQKLMFSKFMSDVEYTEHIAVTPSSASFDVKITGSWGLRKSVSLFTGEATMILAIEPDRVSYGPTSTRADHWKSLGPMNYLDLAYLDEELRIMRGNTSLNTIFVLQRCMS